jgi:hypothetical protein
MQLLCSYSWFASQILDVQILPTLHMLCFTERQENDTVDLCKRLVVKNRNTSWKQTNLLIHEGSQCMWTNKVDLVLEYEPVW